MTKGILLAAAMAFAAAGCASRAGFPGFAVPATENPIPAIAEAAGRAEDPAPGAAARSDGTKERWEFSFTPFLWASGIDATTGIDGRSVSSSASFRDILEHLDLALMARMEARKGRWGIFAEGIYVDLSTDAERRFLGPTTVTLTDFTGTAAGAYRIFEGPVRSGDGAGFVESLALDGYAGARYTRLGVEVDPVNFGSASDSMQWTDPIVGLRARMDVGPRYALLLRGDAGGFRGDSDNSWFVLTGVEWRPSPSFSVELGYAILTQKRRDGDNPGDFELRLKLSGVILGFTFRF